MNSSVQMKPLSLRLVDAINQSNPLQANYLANCCYELNAEEQARFEGYLGFLLERGVSLPYLTECYNTIVEDIKREQYYFVRHKRYRYSSYDEVSASVYLDNGYMERYMYGLGITSFLWPNHVAMNRFFLQHLPKERTGRYLEIGPGHGLHFTTALSLCRYEAYEAVDVSPKSAALTKELVSSLVPGRDGDWNVTISDFLTAELPGQPYHALVMGEVLEHVERPDLFLRRVRDVTSSDAFIYVTTAINAPAIDHIYLLRNAEEFESLVAAAGMRCEHRLVLPYKGKTIEECAEQALPVNLAAVLKKL
jgi:hypothetical protein